MQFMKLHYCKRKRSEDKQHGGIWLVPETPDNHSCSCNPTGDDKLRNISFNPAIVIRPFDNINNGRLFQMGRKYLLALGIFFLFSRGMRRDGATRAALRLENIFITKKKHATGFMLHSLRASCSISQHDRAAMREWRSASACQRQTSASLLQCRFTLKEKHLKQSHSPFTHKAVQLDCSTLLCAHLHGALVCPTSN